MRTSTPFRSCLAIASLLAASVLTGRAEAQPSSWPTLQSVPQVAADASKDAALIIGIDEYAFVPRVEGAASNARDWFTFLVEGQKLPISRAHLLRNRDATREQMLDTAKRVANEVEPGGKLWIVFIGHGAPAADGKDGMLVGVDAQQTASGLYARSIGQKELLAAVAGGAQAETVMVIDACFSGRTGSGAPLAPGLQPLIRVKDAEAPPVVGNGATTIMTAGTNDQFAGPLPGLGRPAFSYLVLGALRGWADRGGKGEVTAQEAVDYAKLALTVVPIGRTQTPEIVSSHPKIALSRGVREKGPELSRVVGGDLPVVDDRKAPTEPGKGPARVRVRATCGRDPRAIAARQGLVVEQVTDERDVPLKPVSDPNPSLKFDDATRERVMMDPEFVEYELTAGPQRIRVRSSKCEPTIEQVTLPAGKTVELAPQLRLLELPVTFRRPEFAAPSDKLQVVDPSGKAVCDSFPCEVKVPAQSGYQVLWQRGSGDPVRASLPEPSGASTTGPTEGRVEYRRVGSALGPVLLIGGGAVAAVGLTSYLVAPTKDCVYTYAADTQGGTLTFEEPTAAPAVCPSTPKKEDSRSHLISTSSSINGAGVALLGVTVVGTLAAATGAVLWVTKWVGRDELDVRIGTPPPTERSSTGVRVGVAPGSIVGSF